MKKSNTWYWIVTGIFVAFILFSAIPNVMQSPDSVKMISADLGYPAYFVPFIGLAKVAGSLALLVPQFRRIKEWAYAGLCFDLVGATYSIVIKEGFHPGILIMLLIIAVLFLSYYLWHKKLGSAA